MDLCLFRISSGNTYLHQIQEHFSLGKYTLELWWMSSRLTALNPLTLFFIYWPLCFLVTFGKQDRSQSSSHSSVEFVLLYWYIVYNKSWRVYTTKCCKWIYKTLPFIKTAVVIGFIRVLTKLHETRIQFTVLSFHTVFFYRMKLCLNLCQVSEIAFSSFQR